MDVEINYKMSDICVDCPRQSEVSDFLEHQELEGYPDPCESCQMEVNTGFDEAEGEVY